MNNAIFIGMGNQLTLEEYVLVAAETMSLIADVAEGLNKIVDTFSVADLSVLLNKIAVHMPGEFEIRRTSSRYLKIVYKSYLLDETEFDDRYIAGDFAQTHDRGPNPLWISEKVLIAFIDRKLYGVAFMLYFYLGYLMTCDAAFAVSQQIGFEKILESCDEFPEDCRVKHPTTLMRALGDLEDAGLVRWHAKSGTFELLHITPYDPQQKL